MRDSQQAGLLTVLGSRADEALSWVTHAARDTLAGVDYVSISAARGNHRLVTLGSTDPLAGRADALQYQLREGPCFETARGADSPIASSDDVADDPQWPLYGPRCAELGIRGQTALRLHRAGRTIGSLNLYSTRPGRLTDEVVARARGYAAQASAALEVSRSLDGLTQSLVFGTTAGGRSKRAASAVD